MRYSIVFVSICMLMLLFSHKSHVPEVFERYSYEYFSLVCVMTLCVIVVGWIFINKDRWELFYRRATTYPLIPTTISCVAVLVVVDGLWDILTVNPLILLLGFFTFAVGFLGSYHPQKILQKTALLTMAIVVSLVVVNILFATFLLHAKIPEDEKSFYREISYSWPQKITKEKPEDTLRILGLCDSFGRAGGHENYHYILQKYFIAQGRKVEVVNFSAGGYEPLHQLYILKKFAAQYQPDVVIHGFFVGNDFANPDTNTSAFAGISVRKRGGIMKLRPHSWVLFQWLRNYYKARNNVVAPGVFKKETFLAIEYERLQICRPYPPAKVRWRDTISIVEQIRKYTQSIHAKYMMMIHPDQFQSDKELQTQLQVQYSIEWKDYQLDIPQKFLRSYCQKNNIPCLDLLPYFKDSEDVLYLKQNTHYNELGNKLAAQKIYAFLQEKKW